MAVSLASAVVGVLMIVAFIGLLRRKWNGPKLLIAAYIVSVVRNILYEVIILSYPSIFGEIGSEVAGYATGSAVFAIGNWIYYSKRRALFSPAQKAKMVYREHKCKEQTESMEQKSVEDGQGENCVTLLERLRDEVENKATNKQHKKKSKKTIILAILLFIFMASTISVSVFAYNEIGKLNLALENLTEENTELLNKYYNALNEAGFWSSRYVVTTESGEKYHRCTCVYVQERNRSTWSIKEAQERGYEPCLVCNPGGIGW